MTPEQLAYQLASWMPPGVLARAASEWREPKGREEASLRFESATLSEAKAAGFEDLVRDFLRHVKIPDEVVTLTRGMYGSHVTDEAANWLRSFEFTGRLVPDPEIAPSDAQRRVLLEIRAPVCEGMVIRGPIDMLNNLVSTKADYWRRVAAVRKPSQVHYQVRGEWPLEPWIDLRVARACGFPDLGDAGRQPAIPIPSNVRGHVSVAGPIPTSREGLRALAWSADLLATSESADVRLLREMKAYRSESGR